MLEDMEIIPRRLKRANTFKRRDPMIDEYNQKRDKISFGFSKLFNIQIFSILKQVAKIANKILTTHILIFSNNVPLIILNNFFLENTILFRKSIGYIFLQHKNGIMLSTFHQLTLISLNLFPDCLIYPIKITMVFLQEIRVSLTDARTIHFFIVAVLLC